MPRCESWVRADDGKMVLECPQQATHTVAYENKLWRGGLDEFYICESCLNYERGEVHKDDQIGAERLPTSGPYKTYPTKEVNFDDILDKGLVIR